MLSEFSTDPVPKKSDTAAYTESWKGMTFLEEQIIVAKDFEVRAFVFLWRVKQICPYSIWMF